MRYEAIHVSLKRLTWCDSKPLFMSNVTDSFITLNWSNWHFARSTIKYKTEKIKQFVEAAKLLIAELDYNVRLNNICAQH